MIDTSLIIIVLIIYRLCFWQVTKPGNGLNQLRRRHADMWPTNWTTTCFKMRSAGQNRRCSLPKVCKINLINKFFLWNWDLIFFRQELSSQLISRDEGLIRPPWMKDWSDLPEWRIDCTVLKIRSSTKLQMKDSEPRSKWRIQNPAPNEGLRTPLLMKDWEPSSKWRIENPAPNEGLRTPLLMKDWEPLSKWRIENPPPNEWSTGS